MREAAAISVATAQGKALLVVAVATRGTFDRARLARHYRNQGGKFGELLRIVQVPRLPRNAAGKVLKDELRRRLRPGRAAG